MTLDTAAAPPPPPRRRWGLYAPAALLLVAAALWSVFWFWAAARAGEAVDVWLAREAKLGRVYACGERHVGGYPFRVEVDCRTVSARLATRDGEVAASAPRFVALAQVYDPKRLIGELTGPVAVTGPDGAKADLTFSEARASARVEGRRFERGSIEIASPRLVTDKGEIGTAGALQAHVRRAPGAAEGTYDVAVAVDRAVSPWFDALAVGSGPASAEVQLRASGLEDLRPGPVDARLRAFAEAGGRVEVTHAKLSRGEVAAEAKGEGGLDREGRLNGSVDVTARGIDGLVKSFVGSGREGGLSSLIGVGAKLLGKKAELDGQPATAYRVSFDKGRVLLGPFKVTRLPPAF